MSRSVYGFHSFNLIQLQIQKKLNNGLHGLVLLKLPVRFGLYKFLQEYDK